MKQSTLPTQLSILHLVLDTGETCPVYNEHCLPVADQRQLTLCTYFSSPTSPPKNIHLLEGDGTLTGFIRVFKQALRDRHYDIIHVHSPHFGIFLPLMAVIYPRLFQKTLFTVHNSYLNFKLKNKLYLLPIFALARRVICCSQASYESFPAGFHLLAGKRLCTVPNGVDLDRVDRILAQDNRKTHCEDKSYEDKSAEFTLISIGRLIDIKAPLVTLSAFQKFLQRTTNSKTAEPLFPRHRLTFVGTGHLVDNLQNSIKAMHLNQQVKFTGLIPRETVYRQLFSADVYISTSRGEGLPIAGLEAMACGCPAILSDIPPHRELAEQVPEIPLVAINDTEGFAKAIEHFNQLSEKERNKIGQQCRQLVEDKFSLTAMHRNYKTIYVQILGY